VAALYGEIWHARHGGVTIVTRMSNKNKSADPDAESRARTTRLMRGVAAVGICWFILGFTLYFWRFHSGLSYDSKDWNDFGVFIAGFSGTGIAAITLYAVAYGIRVQAEDLAKSRAFMAEQSKTMAQQAFDSVFFNLLDRFSEVRDSVGIRVFTAEYLPDRDVPHSKEVIVKGRRAFELFYEKIYDPYKGYGADENRLLFLQRIFENEYRKAESELGPYFRTLYQIFKHVHRGHVTDVQKIDYAKMARAQLSDIELCVIFYNGLTDLAKNFRPLIEKYGILKHVNARNLLIEDDKRNRALYQAGAFE
jgi:hypothetical protein